MTENGTRRGSLHRAVEILEALYTLDEPARFSDIAAATDLPNGTLHRNLSLMCKLGLLYQNAETGTYTIGLLVAKYGSKSLESHPLGLVARQEIERLRDVTGETIRLAVLESGRVRYVDQISAKKPVTIPYNIGDSGPIHCSGTGKAMLAAMSPEEARKTLAQNPIERFTDQTIVEVSAILKHVSEAASKGYIVENGEQIADIRAIGAAITGKDGSLIGAVSVTVPMYRMTLPELEQHAPALLTCVENIQKRASISMTNTPPSLK